MKGIIAAALSCLWTGALLLAPMGSVLAQQSNISEEILQCSTTPGACTGVIYSPPPSTADSNSLSHSWSGNVGGISANGAGYVTDGVLGDTTTLIVTSADPAPVIAATIVSFADSLTIEGGTGTGVLAESFSLSGTGSNSSGLQNGMAGSIVFGDGVGAPTGTEVSLNGGALTVGTRAVIPGAIGPQADSLTVFVPFTYGTAFNLGPVLQSIPEYPADAATPYTSVVNFYNTLTLNSALVYGGTPGALGAENDAAVIGAASGLVYGPNGVSAVPLPATAWLLLSAMVGLWIAGRRGFAPQVPSIYPDDSATSARRYRYWISRSRRSR